MSFLDDILRYLLQRTEQIPVKQSKTKILSYDQSINQSVSHSHQLHTFSC